MNTLRTIPIILFISLSSLLIAGCATPAESPMATTTVELKPTNTPDPKKSQRK